MANTTQRIYFVGNSVTDTIQQAGLDKIAEAESNDLVWGRHMIPGAPLSWILEHPGDGFQQSPFGYYPKALGSYQWDGLLLQPFDRALTGSGGDLESAKTFINLALPKSPDLQVYVYQRWPRVTTENPTAEDWDKAWNAQYVGGWQNNETRSYFNLLTAALKEAYPNLKPPKIVPVGEVMYELNQRMKNGEVPGYSSIWDVYVDAIHLDKVGSYIVASTFYAALYESNRTTNVIPPEYGSINSNLANIIHSVVWETVRELDSTNPGSGGTDIPASLAIADVDVYEDDGKALIDVNLSKSVDTPVTVQYQTQNNTAIAGSDYLAASGTLTFNPGETSKTIEVIILSDDQAEANEDFRITLSNPTNAEVGVDQAKVLIRDALTADVDTVLPDGISNLILLGQNNIKGIGNSGNNIIQGNDGHNVLVGKAGYDQLIGKAGDDIYIIEGSFWDNVVEQPNQGNDTVKASENYTLESNIENLKLLGRADTNGTGNSENNGIVGSGGNNVLDGMEGNDAIKGVNGDDVLQGSSGKDQLLGGNGNDTLEGGRGNDWLDGGNGANVLHGGSGRDTFIIRLRGRMDTILDFEDGKDKLELKKLAFETLEIVQKRENSVILHKEQPIAVLEGTNSTLITVQDFVS